MRKFCKFELQTEDDVWDICLTMTKWRWKCACGNVGRWTYQSSAVPIYAWRRHVERMAKR